MPKTTKQVKQKNGVKRKTNGSKKTHAVIADTSKKLQIPEIVLDKNELQAAYLDHFVKVDKKIAQDVKAEFLNPDYIRENENIIRRLDIRGTRNYIEIYSDGSYLFGPSVTRVLQSQAPTSYGLKEFNLNNTKEKTEWILEHSSHYGTFLHIFFMDIILGAQVFLSDEFLFKYMEEAYKENGFDYIEGRKWYAEQGRDLKKDIFGFLKFVQDFKVRPLAIEWPFVLKGYRCGSCGNTWLNLNGPKCADCGSEEITETGLYAGTIDLVAKISVGSYEFVAVIDYKSRMSGFYESDALQLYAYFTAWNAKNPELQAEGMYSYCCRNFKLPLGKTATLYQVKDQTKNECNWKWWHYLKGYHKDEESRKIPSITAFDPQMKLDIDSDLMNVLIDVNPLVELVCNEKLF